MKYDCMKHEMTQEKTNTVSESSWKWLQRKKVKEAENWVVVWTGKLVTDGDGAGVWLTSMLTS